MFEVEHLVAGHDRATHVEARDRTGHGAGCQDDVGTGDRCRTAVVHRDRNGPVRAEGPDTVEDLDVAALAHGGDTADESGDDLLLALLGDREVHRRRTRLDAEVGAVFDVAFDRRRLQERFGRDTPPVETGTAQGVLLDEGHLHAGGCGVQRGGVPARATTDDDEIERISHGRHRIAPTHG